MSSLDLGIVGNSNVSALVTAAGEICWTCLPRVDGDPVFCSLLREGRNEKDHGFLAVELEGLARTEQAYLPHTAVLVTRLFDASGGAVEVTAFAPRPIWAARASWWANCGPPPPFSIFPASTGP